MTDAMMRCAPPEEVVSAKRAARMEKIDELSPEWRALVHEYGFTIIDAMRGCGVAKARHARHLIETVLNEMSAFRGSFSSQGTRMRLADHLVMIPREPTTAMIEASMDTVSSFDMAVTKREKHRLRLKAAIEAAPGVRRGGG